MGCFFKKWELPKKVAARLSNKEYIDDWLVLRSCSNPAGLLKASRDQGESDGTIN
jgi:hypothetical protein